MRYALAILLFALVSYQYVLKLGIVAWYEYNKDYIASNLCENRDKPQLKCCGKCYLKKQLAKADGGSRSEKIPSSPVHKSEIHPFVLPQSVVLAGSFFEPNKVHSYYRTRSVEEVPLATFHPPG